jgi:hypothetical protein
MIPYCDVEGDDANIAIIIENKGIKLLVRALQVSGRVFPMKVRGVLTYYSDALS